MKADNNKDVRDDGNKIDKTIVNLSNKLKNNKSKNIIYMPNIETMKKSTFLILNAKKTFNYLKQTFIKALILQCFDLKYYIISRLKQRLLAML